MLDEAAFAKARSFLMEKARPLEAARYLFHFEGGSVDAVLAELRPYQNADGGFGHALEPDLRAPESSALATSVAFQILREIGAVRDRRVADRALRYLLSTCDRRLGGWRIVPPTTDASPHAPWWQQAGRDHDYDEFSLNPNAELLGVMFEAEDLVSDETLGRISSHVASCLERQVEFEMHDLLCCLRLVRSPAAPQALVGSVQRRIAAALPTVLGRDRDAWATYALRPLQVIDAPDSPFLPGLEEALETNLDYEIETQQADGSWVPSWSWGDLYPEVWPVAQREWAGVLTLQNLRRLDRFGRVEGRDANRQAEQA